jgi:hypothetical protein
VVLELHADRLAGARVHLLDLHAGGPALEDEAAVVAVGGDANGQPGHRRAVVREVEHGPGVVAGEDRRAGPAAGDPDRVPGAERAGVAARPEADRVEAGVVVGEIERLFEAGGGDPGQAGRRVHAVQRGVGGGRGGERERGADEGQAEHGASSR